MRLWSSLLFVQRRIHWYVAGTLALFGLFVLTMAGLASAHGLNPNRGVIRVVGKKVYVILTPSLPCFEDHDTDHDGVFSEEEIRKARTRLQVAMRREFRLASLNRSGEVQEEHPRVVFEDVSTPHLHGGDEPNYIRWEYRVEFQAPVEHLRVQWGLAKAAGLKTSIFAAKDAPAVQDQVPLGQTHSFTFSAFTPATIVHLGGAQEPLQRPRLGEEHDPVDSQEKGSRWLLVVLCSAVAALGLFLTFRRKRA